MSISRPRIPPASWSAIGWSCAAENQPGSGTDIELCVAASATSFSGRAHSSRWPLQAPPAGAGVIAAPVPAKAATATAIAATANAATAPVLHPAAAARGARRRLGRPPG